MLFARQAIFDRGGSVVGYELLYRAAADRLSAGTGDPDMMASTILVSAFLDADLPTVLEGRLPWVNVPRQLLLDGAVELLDPGSVVIEILETIEVDAEVLGACQRLREAGYSLALDDYVAGDHRRPLLPFVDVVKVDVLGRATHELRDLVRGLPTGVRLLAEKVEDAEAHATCQQLGFELFQGYFYRRPKITERRALAPDLLRTLMLMNLLRGPEVPQTDVVQEFESDPALTLRLVRMANVAAVGVREVSSISHAIGLLGRGPLYRWLALIFAAAAAGPGGAKRELLRETIFRARFCEVLAQRSGSIDPGEAFLTGLFSGMEALLEQPLGSVLELVRLAPAVAQAVTLRQGPLAWVLAAAFRQEEGDWSGALELVSSHGARLEDVDAAHADALAWTQQSLNATR